MSERWNPRPATASAAAREKTDTARERTAGKRRPAEGRRGEAGEERRTESKPHVPAGAQNSALVRRHGGVGNEGMGSNRLITFRWRKRRLVTRHFRRIIQIQPTQPIESTRVRKNWTATTQGANNAIDATKPPRLLDRVRERCRDAGTITTTWGTPRFVSGSNRNPPEQRLARDMWNCCASFVVAWRCRCKRPCRCEPMHDAG